MFKCPICNKQVETKFQLVGHSRSHKKTQKQLDYEKNPLLCKRCNLPISYHSYVEGYKPIFCSGSCRSKYFIENLKNAQ